jgi:DNA-binding NtrC family response regulator
MSQPLDDATTQLLQAALSQPPVTSPTVTVTVVEGPSAGLRVVFDDLAHRQALVGQSPTCDVRLADKTVSRRHLALGLGDLGVVLDDLESTNGTRVAGLRVERAILVGGESIELGSSTLRLEIGAERRPLPAADAASFGAFLGASASARRLYLVLARFAQLEVPLLLQGEAGTGKELLAESIHEAGPRARGPVLVLERGRGHVAEVERTLFGGGGEGAPGMLERARGGTLFVDEIGDLELPLQLKLLRALETRTARRVDAAESYAVDVRFVAATRRNLDRDVHARRFREELLTFLSPGRIDVPSLRHRRGDVTLLAKVFWSRFGGDPAHLSPTFVQRLEEHRWPGNVRELMATIATQIVETEGAPILEAVPMDAEATASEDFIGTILSRGLPFARARQEAATAFEARYVAHMLRSCGGNVTRAAAASGMSRRHYYRLKSKTP